MKHVVFSLIAFALVLSGADAATGRLGVQQNTVSSARMPSIPVTTVGVTTSVSNLNNNPPAVPDETKPDEPEQPDMREKEREACIRNNVGVGNTFVWASRYSDTNNYATMVEDTEHPENNICFVRVELKSSDPKLDLSDIGGRYFEMGRNITCGSWVDEGMIEKRILDAKKNVRTWATVGGAVGGAALGVGSMELFGNKLIGGAVEGQKAGTTKDQFRAYLLSLSDTERKDWVNYFEQMYKACNDWKAEYGDTPTECDGFELGDEKGKKISKYSYEEMMNILK